MTTETDRARAIVTKLLIENKLETAQNIIDAMIVFATSERQAERERCAQVCRDQKLGQSKRYDYIREECAEAIERLAAEAPKPIQAHSKTEYKRMVAQGADVLPPAVHERAGKS